MSADFAHTDWATEQRTQKAVRLEAHLHGMGVGSSIVPRLTVDEKREVERAAGVRRCSDETWQMVANLMRSAEGQS